MWSFPPMASSSRLKLMQQTPRTRGKEIRTFGFHFASSRSLSRTASVRARELRRVWALSARDMKTTGADGAAQARRRTGSRRCT